MEPWQWLLTRDAADAFDGCTKRDRLRLLAVFDYIACFPFAAGVEQWAPGKKSPVHCGVFGKWSVSWWVDFPAKEVQVLDIEQTR